MSTGAKALGVAMGGIASSSQAAVSSTITATAVLTQVATQSAANTLLLNQLRQDLIAAGIIKGSA